MNKLLCVSVLAMAACTLTACKEEATAQATPSVKLEVMIEPNVYSVAGSSTLINITSLEDNPIEITEVLINRGNSCNPVSSISRKGSFDTKNLTFGFSQTAQAYARCDVGAVREVQVQTNKGVFAYTF